MMYSSRSSLVVGSDESIGRGESARAKSAGSHRGVFRNRDDTDRREKSVRLDEPAKRTASKAGQRTQAKRGLDWDGIDITAAAKGDGQVFGELFKRFNPLLVNIVTLSGRGQYYIEEVGQRVWSRLASGSLQRFDTTKNFAPWFSTIVRREIIDLWRREDRRKMIPLGMASPIDSEFRELALPDQRACGGYRSVLDQIIAAEDVERLRACLCDDFGDSFELGLHLAGELTGPQAAELAGIPLGTVKSRSHAIRGALRKQLSDI